jgi:hypothetical protein
MTTINAITRRIDLFSKWRGCRRRPLISLIELLGFLQFHDAERPTKRTSQDERKAQIEQAVKVLPVEKVVEYLNEEAQPDQPQPNFTGNGANAIDSALLHGHHRLLTPIGAGTFCRLDSFVASPDFILATDGRTNGGSNRYPSRCSNGRHLGQA